MRINNLYNIMVEKFSVDFSQNKIEFSTIDKDDKLVFLTKSDLYTLNITAFSINDVDTEYIKSLYNNKKPIFIDIEGTNIRNVYAYITNISINENFGFNTYQLTFKVYNYKSNITNNYNLLENTLYDITDIKPRLIFLDDRTDLIDNFKQIGKYKIYDNDKPNVTLNTSPIEFIDRYNETDILLDNILNYNINGELIIRYGNVELHNDGSVFSLNGELLYNISAIVNYNNYTYNLQTLFDDITIIKNNEIIINGIFFKSDGSYIYRKLKLIFDNLSIYIISVDADVETSILVDFDYCINSDYKLLQPQETFETSSEITTTTNITTGSKNYVVFTKIIKNMLLTLHTTDSDVVIYNNDFVYNNSTKIITNLKPYGNYIVDMLNTNPDTYMGIIVDNSYGINGNVLQQIETFNQSFKSSLNHNISTNYNLTEAIIIGRQRVTDYFNKLVTISSGDNSYTINIDDGIFVSKLYIDGNIEYECNTDYTTIPNLLDYIVVIPTSLIEYISKCVFCMNDIVYGWYSV